MTIDLTAAGDAPRAWSLRDQFGRPLAAPFPFCRTNRLDEVAEVRLVNAEGDVVQAARLSAEGRLDAVLGRAFGWGAKLLERELRRLAGGAPRPAEAALALDPTFRPAAGEPVGWRVLASDLAGRLARRIGDWTLDETWTIGMVERPIESFLDDPVARDVRWIEAPRGSYYADPFGLPGESAIFCERFDHETGAGRLVAVSPGGSQGGGGLRGARERPLDLGIRGHASFPFMATDGEGRTLCVPEAEASRRLVIWRRADDGGWRQLAVAAEGVRAIDPSLFAWEGRWWLAYTDGDLGPSDNLCLLHAPAGLEGPWLPHPGNPVKVDVRSSRSAGTPFVAQGRLYRPAQDCAGGYGAAVVINRVTLLTPDGFAEEPAARIAPTPDGRGRDGLHTLSSWGGRTLIDVKGHGLVPAALRRRVTRRGAALARLLLRRGATTRTAEAET